MSVIIVNFNVKYFLEQCLCSVFASIQKSRLRAEVIVIDNNSLDGSSLYIGRKFSQVQYIFLEKNIGFGAANNIGLASASGKYILFLNPDMLLQERSLADAFSFMEKNSSCTALGFRLIDGSGNYLPESKRGKPSAWNSFCKLTGLSAAFSKSEIFAGYYLGHLQDTQSARIDVLPGACMFVRKAVLDEAGSFDERFFMYAEDIDLSLRLTKKTGYNYYLADVTAIHFKGESTTKNAAYVALFYKAMWQFAKKYNTGIAGSLYRLFLGFGIGFRYLLALVFNNSKKQSTQNHISAIAFIGDAGVVSDRRRASERNKILVLDEPNEAHTIVLCEGESFSFEDMIQYIQEKPGKRYLFTAANSASIVGSWSKNSAGIQIGFE